MPAGPFISFMDEVFLILNQARLEGDETAVSWITIEVNSGVIIEVEGARKSRKARLATSTAITFNLRRSATTVGFQYLK